MGLQGQLSDVSSESIPILLVAIIAKCVGYLRSLLFPLLQSLGLSPRCDPIRVDDGGLFGAVGAGFAGLVFLSEQLNLNRVLSHRFSEQSRGGSNNPGDCVVCLNRFRDGDQVRTLPCRHVFHKGCFDGWLDHLNLNCPLCRSSLVPDERVALTERRVTGDLLTWFSLR